MESEICLWRHDGSVEVVHRGTGRIEAPNWCADGSLLVNAEGRLWRLAPGADRLTPVETGFATQLNNDHVPSPDGQVIAISDKAETGASCIYLVPAAGGAPHRLTAQLPSWMHGWSPDGRRVVYAGARDGGPVGIYLAEVETGDETCVTAGFDHADGPDFSADGRWIWFNGERDGAVDIWRIRPDGTTPERMTDGPGVDWFPHPSPDGRHVVHLRYPPGTQGHPADLDVALWLLPQAGGEGREIVRFRGGQGSLNVPCWAPDSSSFAFVRYPA
ncbi:Tol biopolymer transport system component [Limimaricola variabilis]|uniref:Tol biopolymer transport system component n=1 Tax=Limimaricola variabilis TaxID=1492771 RepID=A0ABR6HMA7_9RHOB|nr:PD40 domain-containing protein [Limimaricola variabilis]MBB3711706.1 Tol biopolymer transport system component [Limimaricola variabilis]